MRYEVVMNTAIGATQSVNFDMNFEESDPFLDSYNQEIFVCHDILDKVRYLKSDVVTLTLTKDFLVKIIHSHIHHIRKVS